MYDEELAFTGLGTFAIGGFVFEAWLLALIALGATFAGIALLRVAGSRR
jgi:hypothetical protein